IFRTRFINARTFHHTVITRRTRIDVEIPIARIKNKLRQRMHVTLFTSNVSNHKFPVCDLSIHEMEFRNLHTLPDIEKSIRSQTQSVRIFQARFQQFQLVSAAAWSEQKQATIFWRPTTHVDDKERLSSRNLHDGAWFDEAFLRRRI